MDMKENVRNAITLAPPLALLLLFFFIPLMLSVKNSVNDVNGEFIGISTYVDVLNDPRFVDAFVYTFGFSLVSTVVAVVAAVVIAMAIRGTFLGKKISLFLFQMNVSIPHLSVAAMMLFLLLPTGFLSSLSYQMGLIDSYSEFPDIVKGSGSAGIIISFAWKFTPFIGLAVLSVLQSAVPDYERQAATLGIGPWNRFRHITLPMIAPAIIMTSIVSFAYAFGSYEVPLLLGIKQTLVAESYNMFRSIYGLDHLDRAYVISNIITVITLALAAVYFWFASSKEKRRYAD